MDTFFYNKIAGAVLFSVLMVMVVRLFAGFIYSSPLPDKPGYKVEVAQAGQGEEKPEQAAPEEVVSLAALMAAADVERGAKVARTCAACHTFNSGGANKIGPNLFAVLGKKMGGVAGFSYSDALLKMASEGGTWGYEELAAFLAKPKQFMPGTKMTFPGVKKPKDRADLLAYLRSLGSSSVPLPEE